MSCEHNFCLLVPLVNSTLIHQGTCWATWMDGLGQTRIPQRSLYVFGCLPGLGSQKQGNSLLARNKWGHFQLAKLGYSHPYRVASPSQELTCTALLSGWSSVYRLLLDAPSTCELLSRLSFRHPHESFIGPVRVCWPPHPSPTTSRVPPDPSYLSRPPCKLHLFLARLCPSRTSTHTHPTRAQTSPPQMVMVPISAREMVVGGRWWAKSPS
jgi:hypothetical protein